VKSPPNQHSTDHEHLAVVDADDTVIGSMTRREIHERGLRHRAVHILVFDHHGRLCLQKRSIRKDINPGAWDTSAAGHVDFGESYECAAHRELEEELGIRPSEHLMPIGQIRAAEATGWEFVRVFATRHVGTLTVNEEEIDELDWITLQDLETLLLDADAPLTRSFRRVWDCFLESGLGPTFLSQA